MHSPSPIVSVVTRAALACGTVTMLMLGATAPASATHTKGDDPHQLAALVAKVADADQQLSDLGGQIRQRQEGVNRALLAVTERREAAAGAAQDVTDSRRTLEEGEAAITAAQKRFDSFAASVYVNGPPDSLIWARTPEELVAATSANTTLTTAFRQALTDLQRTRSEQANKESAALAAQNKADAAVADAQRSFEAAVSTLTSAQTAFASQQQQVDLLVVRRDSARSELEEAKRNADSDRGASAVVAPPVDAANWDAGGAKAGWDLVVPTVPSAVAGDPVAIINTVLQVSATSAQVTADLGRKFLAQLGLLPAAAVPETGITNGRIPYVNGRQASEYVIRRAMAQIGVPYSWGAGTATGPSRGIDGGANTVGFDCSGLMLYAFAGVGIKLPHYSGAQYDAGRKVPVAQMRRGDLLFWGANASQHEAMYLGDGMMLEAQQTGVPVKVSPVRTSGMMPYATRLIEY